MTVPSPSTQVAPEPAQDNPALTLALKALMPFYRAVEYSDKLNELKPKSNCKPHHMVISDEFRAAHKAYVELSNLAALPPKQGEEPVARVEELAMLIRMLVRHVPDGKQVKASAVDYLRRHGLQGNPLRDELTSLQTASGVVAAEVPVAWVCAADMDVMRNKDGDDVSMSPRIRPDLGMKTPLYATAPSAALAKRMNETRDGALKEAKERLEHELAVNPGLSAKDMIEWVESLRLADTSAIENGLARPADS